MKRTILLHVCCGPCSIYPTLLLKQDYHIIGFFYNPNIFPFQEYQVRLNYTKYWFKKQQFPLIIDKYEHGNWLSLTGSLKNEPEGGSRCQICFKIRLLKTAQLAYHLGIPIFSTTLTTGPNKPSKVIFPLGLNIANRLGISFLDIDFKKRDGFKISCKISKEEEMYRQNYCGCEFSKRLSHSQIKHKNIYKVLR